MDAALQEELSKYEHWIDGYIIGGDSGTPSKVTGIEVQYGKAALRLETGMFIVAKEARLVIDANGNHRQTCIEARITWPDNAPGLEVAFLERVIAEGFQRNGFNVEPDMIEVEVS